MSIANNLSGNYYLTADITLPANTIIGSQKNPFTGTLDGNGHSINNYTITKATNNIAGIFAAATGATFKDLTLKNVKVNISTPYISYGSLIVYAKDCVLSGLTVSGAMGFNVSGGEYGTFTIGGLVGYLGGKSTMTNCHNKATIKAETTGGKYWDSGIVCGLVEEAPSIQNSPSAPIPELLQ